MHVIAAKAVAFGEALRPDFKVYAKNVVDNARALAETLRSAGFDIVSGGTDNHLMLVDLRPKQPKGNVSEKALVRAGLTCNKNGIPFDPEKPFVTSGIRLGTPAGTTRGFGVAEFRQVGQLIAEVLDAVAQSEDGAAPLVEAAVKEKVQALTDAFPDLSRLSRSRRTATGHALPLLRQSRHPGEGFASVRGQYRDPPPARLHGLRRPLHHLRAGAAARTDGGQAERPPGAVRPRQADALGPGGAAQARRSTPSGSSAWSPASSASSKARGESEIASEQIGHLVMEGLRGLDDVAYRPLRLGLQEFPRGQGLRGRSSASCPAMRRPRLAKRRTSAGRAPTPSAGSGRRSTRARPAVDGGGAAHRPPQSRPDRTQPRGRRADRPDGGGQPIVVGRGWTADGRAAACRDRGAWARPGRRRAARPPT